MEERHYDFLVEHAIEMFLAFGKDGVITYANRSANRQLEYENGLVGTSICDIFPASFEMMQGEFKTEVKLKDEFSTLMAYRKNKTCFKAECKIMELLGGEEYICMMRDISSQDFLEKRIEQVKQEAEAAMKVKSEFVANVTHELRTPVNGILGNTRTLLEQELEDKQRNTLGLIERGCNDMNNIINNILDFSKLEAGKFTLEPREFDFRSMIDYVKSNHIPKITEKGLQFFVSVSPEIPEIIIGDELRIVQILNNLLSNACKFTSFGKVSLEVLKTAQDNNRMELFFWVIDTGVGIEPAGLDKLFKSFSQVDASVSRKFGGTGLGLNICKQLVTLMNGSINVESEPNKGTMFSFSIWVEIPESEVAKNSSTVVSNFKAPSLATVLDENGVDEVKSFGTKENLEEIINDLSKLILCVEMENWEKAEMFLETIRQLTMTAPKEIKTAMLKLKMAVQKEDYENTATAHETLQGLLHDLM